MTRTFLRPGSVEVWASAEGNGHKPQVEAYPFQGLALDVEPYDYGWLQAARSEASLVRLGNFEAPCVPAGGLKYWGRYSPLGTHLGVLAREGHDMLAAPCGLCGRNLARCRCDMEGAA